MEDSDSCGDPFGLTGDSGLVAWLAFAAVSAGLPVFSAMTSQRAVHADPARVFIVQ
jgi:hypothetical protein